MTTYENNCFNYTLFYFKKLGNINLYTFQLFFMPCILVVVVLLL